jgi:hypothetical protein
MVQNSGVIRAPPEGRDLLKEAPQTLEEMLRAFTAKMERRKF